MSFQDELRERIPKEENDRDMRQLRTAAEARKIYQSIKANLKFKVSKKDYSVHNGIAEVTYIANISERFMHVEEWDNMAQIRANSRKLFKDPLLKPNARKTYSVAPEFREEYELFCSSLRELAQMDQISCTVILHEGLLKWERPFPTRLVGVGECHPRYALAVKCSTSFSIK